MYETVLTEHPEIGSVCSGGRYDDLAGYYTDRKLPGVGISIGLTRLFYVLEEQGMLSEEMNLAPADALVIPMGDGTLGRSRLRRHGFTGGGRAHAAPFRAEKIQGQTRLRGQTDIPFAVIVGEDECAAGLVSLKDLGSGEQVTVSPAEAAKRVLAAVSRYGAARPIRDM